MLYPAQPDPRMTTFSFPVTTVVLNIRRWDSAVGAASGTAGSRVRNAGRIVNIVTVSEGGVGDDGKNDGAAVVHNISLSLDVPRTYRTTCAMPRFLASRTD